MAIQRGLALIRKKDLLGVARNAAAGGGYAGLPFDQEQQTTLVNALMNDDMQQWLQNVLSIQGTGLTGPTTSSRPRLQRKHGLWRHPWRLIKSNGRSRISKVSNNAIKIKQDCAT